METDCGIHVRMEKDTGETRGLSRLPQSKDNGFQILKNPCILMKKKKEYFSQRRKYYMERSSQQKPKWSLDVVQGTWASGKKKNGSLNSKAKIIMELANLEVDEV